MEKPIQTGKPGQAGYTYLLLLAFLVILGVLTAVANQKVSYLIQKNREKELMFAGKAYQKAIQSFYSTKETQRFPNSLEDLLKDPRFLLKRHIPRLYKDPFGKDHSDWQLIRNQSGGITGLYSNSMKKPLKQTDFPKGYEMFEKAESYQDWIFDAVQKNEIK